MDINLYQVFGGVTVFEGFKYVVIRYFVCERPGASPYNGRYAEVILDYDNSKGKPNAEGLIDELFTLDEAERFIAWFKKQWPEIGAELKLKQVELPVSNNFIGVSDLPVGRWEGFVDIDRDEGYNLPFEVCGYYNLRDRETVIDSSSGYWKHG